MSIVAYISRTLLEKKHHSSLYFSVRRRDIARNRRLNQPQWRTWQPSTSVDLDCANTACVLPQCDMISSSTALTKRRSHHHTRGNRHPLARDESHLADARMCFIGHRPCGPSDNEACSVLFLP